MKGLEIIFICLNFAISVIGFFKFYQEGGKMNYGSTQR